MIHSQTLRRLLCITFALQKFNLSIAPFIPDPFDAGSANGIPLVVGGLVENIHDSELGSSSWGYASSPANYYYSELGSAIQGSSSLNHYGQDQMNAHLHQRLSTSSPANNYYSELGSSIPVSSSLNHYDQGVMNAYLPQGLYASLPANYYYPEVGSAIQASSSLNHYGQDQMNAHLHQRLSTSSPANNYPLSHTGQYLNENPTLKNRSQQLLPSAPDNFKLFDSTDLTEECVKRANSFLKAEQRGTLYNFKDQKQTFKALFQDRNKATSNLAKSNNAYRRLTLQVGNFPIMLLVGNEKFLVRLLSQSKDASNDTTIKSHKHRFINLMAAVQFFHQLLSAHIDIPHGSDAPTNWLANVVFGSNSEKSLPLLGTIEFEQLHEDFQKLQLIKDLRNLALAPSFTTKQSTKYEADFRILFGDAQLCASNFLTKPNKNMESLGEVALSLLGYWYENVAWRGQNLTIDPFWELMLSALDFSAQPEINQGA